MSITYAFEASLSPQNSRLGLHSETLSHQKETNETPKTLFQGLKNVINQNRSQTMEKANEGEENKTYFCKN